METVKKIIKAIISWIKGNGIEGILGLGIGIWMWFAGHNLIAGIGFGVFVCMNWSMFKKWISNKLGI